MRLINPVLAALLGAILFFGPCCLPKASAHLPAEIATDGVTMPAVELQLAGNVSRPDDHAPISLMGDHTHKRGDWMLSYKYMYMYMDGMQDDGRKLTNNDVLSQNPVTPLRMHMSMHMLGAMYAPHDKLTVSAMVPFIQQTMLHRNRMGTRFKTRGVGLGDIQANALTPLLKTDHHEVIAKMGVSFPTGSINQRDNTPAGDDRPLPYPMQLGSGTWDFLPGITYRGHAGKWGWGAQAGGRIRHGKNHHGYRLGNTAFVSPWVSRQWTPWLSTSIRANAKTWGRITGADDRLNPAMIPTANPVNFGGKQLDVAFGVNLLKTKGFLKNQRIAVEVGMPVYQHLDGPQLRQRFFVTAGWQWAIQ